MNFVGVGVSTSLNLSVPGYRGQVHDLMSRGGLLSHVRAHVRGLIKNRTKRGDFLKYVSRPHFCASGFSIPEVTLSLSPSGSVAQA